LSEDEALKLITWNPAWQLDIHGRVGSLETGKDADLAIWNGHPLSVYSRVDTTFVDGEVLFDRERDLARRQNFMSERFQLEQAEPNRPPQSSPARQAPRGRRPTADVDLDEVDHP
jgi:adenine deaminase